MHVRFSMVIGMPVVEDQYDTTLGLVSNIQLNPDTGAIIGFFVRDLRLFGGREHFLLVADIIGWGTVIHIRDDSRLALPEDLIRLSALLSDDRHILGQIIMTKKSKRVLGVCTDVQFDTRHFELEWLFPKKWWFFSGVPVPASDIIEVKTKAIFVREPSRIVMARNDEEENIPLASEVLQAPTMQTQFVPDRD